MAQLYYTAPTEDAFNEMKAAAIKVWGKYDDTYGYATEKISRIKGIQNVQDNFMYILAMFDHLNQRDAIALLSEPTKDAVRERMIDGGNDPRDLTARGL